MKANRIFCIALLLPLLAACAGSEKRRLVEEQRSAADINMQVAASDIEEARKAGAPTLAPERYNQAQATLKSAGEHFRSKDYAESKKLALHATVEAKDAKAKAEEAKQKEREARARSATPTKPTKKKMGSK